MVYSGCFIQYRMCYRLLYVAKVVARVFAKILCVYNFHFLWLYLVSTSLMVMDHF